ncbi:class I SAM-dependent methyltransferase [Pseudoroseomonas wenyumeiae]
MRGWPRACRPAGACASWKSAPARGHQPLRAAAAGRGSGGLRVHRRIALFLARARGKFAAWPGMDYRLLDIERDPAEQGIEPGSVDLVIAANVLHATRDLSETLAHVRRMLRPGGTWRCWR